MRTILFGSILMAACGQPVRIVDQPIAVRVTNQPAAPGWSGGGGAAEAPVAVWINECVQVPRLGEGEPRSEWLRRIEVVIEERSIQVSNVSYPPGDGVEIALVCFSTNGR